MNVLFICNGNVARSQIAEALWNWHFGKTIGMASSAGVNPNYELADQFKVVMKELGVPIDGHRSKHVNEFDLNDFEWIVTFSNEADEYVKAHNVSANHCHYDVSDPGWNGTIEQYRYTRDVIDMIVTGEWQ